MATDEDVLTAVVCDDEGAFRSAVVRVVMGTGFEVAAVVDAFAEVPRIVLACSARLAVVALPLTGVSGLRAVQALRATATDCDVVLLSPSRTMELAALEAGARALVPEDDLRVLRGVLQELVVEPRRPQLPRSRPQPDGAAAVAGSVSRKALS